MTNQDALAVEIAALDARIKAETEKLAQLKAKLVEKVGDEGATIDTVTATVTVTARTSDRPTGTYLFALDVDTFNAQDEHIQANLVKQGIVNKRQKVIAGQNPVVKVKAK